MNNYVRSSDSEHSRFVLKYLDKMYFIYIYQSSINSCQVIRPTEMVVTTGFVSKKKNRALDFL